MRDATSYRGYRRNEAKRTPGGLAAWRNHAAVNANALAKLDQRANQANAAREVAAKALTEPGLIHLPRALVANGAFLGFYRGEKWTRPVNRIIRNLEAAARSTH